MRQRDVTANLWERSDDAASRSRVRDAGSSLTRQVPPQLLQLLLARPRSLRVVVSVTRVLGPSHGDPQGEAHQSPL